MDEALPIACSLDPSELSQRLATIARVGRDGLIGQEIEGKRHLLRFRPGAVIRERLEEIVAAESECCSFLDLALKENDGEIVLSIAAPQDGQPVADELAQAFAGGSA